MKRKSTVLLISITVTTLVVPFASHSQPKQTTQPAVKKEIRSIGGVIRPVMLRI
ncbi:hypothetical protein [Alteromonas stellipolaris]|uniref:hypothetical protein n=1 Tax=Alteromonas stellipolaris TaxID=233316 RepID=UPI000ABB871E